MPERIIYLDYNATTPVDPSVIEAMLPWFSESFANAASSHGPGRRASAAIDDARMSVAELIDAYPGEIVFTSGATEANNMALKGAIEYAPPGRCRVLVGETEHKAVLDTAGWLAERGVKVEIVPCQRNGVVTVEALSERMSDDVALVSIMLANNETGVISPVTELATVAHEHGALFHTDATQAAGRIPLSARALDIDIASLSAHKMYGPKGVGAIFIKAKTPVAPLLHGGGHENGHRSGTLNVPGIVGLGMAAEVAKGQLEADASHSAALVALIEERITSGFAEALSVTEDPVTGFRPDGLPNTLTLRFPGVDGDALMANAPGIAVSSGSACTSRVPSPSHVLSAMFRDVDAAAECIRISVGRPTTSEEAFAAADEIVAAANRVDGLMKA